LNCIVIPQYKTCRIDNLMRSSCIFYKIFTRVPQMQIPPTASTPLELFFFLSSRSRLQS